MQVDRLGNDRCVKSYPRWVVRTLDAGSLPAQLAEEPISERTVGPQLGRDNLILALIACSFGLVVVAVHFAFPLAIEAASASTETPQTDAATSIGTCAVTGMLSRLTWSDTDRSLSTF